MEDESRNFKEEEKRRGENDWQLYIYKYTLLGNVKNDGETSLFKGGRIESLLFKGSN